MFPALHPLHPPLLVPDLPLPQGGALPRPPGRDPAPARARRRQEEGAAEGPHEERQRLPARVHTRAPRARPPRRGREPGQVPRHRAEQLGPELGLGRAAATLHQQPQPRAGPRDGRVRAAPAVLLPGTSGLKINFSVTKIKPA